MPTGFLAGHRYEITNMSAIAVMNQIYESLFIYDGNADIKPLLIERWNVSDNGKKYTFFLKQRVLFHNYNEMTSRDVVYSLKEVAQESSRLIQLPIQDLNSSIIECGRYCVEINFIKPCQKLLSVLTGSVFKIFPDGSLGENNVPPGTGPFMITKMGDDFIKAARFDRYREKTKSNIDTVFFKHMIKEDALGAFTENGVDDLFEYVLTEQEARSLRGVIVSRPTFIINYIGLNSKLYPFNNI